MLRVTTTLALALCLLGCGSAAQSDEPRPWPSGAPAGFSTDIIGNSCAAPTYLVGLLIADPEGGAALLSDDDVINRLVWRMGFSPRRLPDSQIEVLDGNGTVVATTGRRYRIGGQDAPFFHGFWVCGAVIPQ